jgi:methionine-rich copper-binding protein CopC
MDCCGAGSNSSLPILISVQRPDVGCAPKISAAEARRMQVHLLGNARSGRALFALFVLGASVFASSARSASTDAAAFDHSNPRPGQVLISAPAQLDIYAATALAPSDLNAIDVRAADLREVDQGKLAIDPTDPRRLSVALAPALGPGRYVVSFVDQTSDGAVDRGQFSFYVGAPPTADQRLADTRLSVGGPSTAQIAAPSSDAQGAVALGIAVALAGTITADTAITLRRRSRPMHR